MNINDFISNNKQRSKKSIFDEHLEDISKLLDLDYSQKQVIEYLKTKCKNKTGLTESNLSRYLKKPKKQNVIEVKNIVIDKPKDLTKDNSGTKSILNASQEQLIARIDQLIDEALIFYKRDSQTRKIIDSYGDQTNNIKKDLAQEDFNILTNWHNRKQELKSRVLDYFHLRFNSSLKFDKKLIIEVGFEPCKVCIKNAENL